MAYEAQLAETVLMRGHRGDRIDAYLARPLGRGPHPGVVVIHHMPGWDGPHKEIARRFAHHGFVTILPNLHFREGKATPEENSASVRAAGGMPDDRTMEDVQGAIDYLRELPYLNGKVGVIGYCSGGRQAYLAACTVRGVEAVIDCYSGGVVAKPEELDRGGLFGVEDTRPSPDDTAKTKAALEEHGKTFEFQTYDNTGHAFFAVDRPQYRQHAAVDGWKKVLGWFDTHLR
jgi:carboxymethylenebutenolidase